mmetsp:Transcript_40648/g.73211  ORF Transcript_40648/g.73211 Transcript_40648/m.73211 type:complete len:154 (+) Transcript_40648:38-499(+)
MEPSCSLSHARMSEEPEENSGDQEQASSQYVAERALGGDLTNVDQEAFLRQALSSVEMMLDPAGHEEAERRPAGFASLEPLSLPIGGSVAPSGTATLAGLSPLGSPSPLGGPAAASPGMHFPAIVSPGPLGSPVTTAAPLAVKSKKATSVGRL